TGVRGNAAYLDVANGGPVLPADLVPQLFEPFRRANGHDGAGDEPGDGAGLGLSIVRSVAAAHAGSVAAAGRPAGGLEASVLLPLPAGAPPEGTLAAAEDGGRR